MPEYPLPNVAVLREAMIATAKLLATPIVFSDLMERGVLGPGKGGWYELLHVGLLPKHARQQAAGMKQQTRGGKSRTFLKFGKKNATAARLYQCLTGESFKVG